ncbi:MAG: hypothetical protein ABSD71_09975, partial [Bacteroidales bacterium]
PVVVLYISVIGSRFTLQCYIFLGISDFGTECSFFCEQKKERKKTLFPAARNFLKISVFR